jgi:hypothetical protein
MRYWHFVWLTVVVSRAQGQHEKQPFVLDDFAEAQTNQRTQKALPALESVYGRMEATLERICRDVTKQARLYQESIRDESELTDKTGVNLYQVRGDCKPGWLRKRERQRERERDTPRGKRGGVQCNGETQPVLSTPSTHTERADGHDGC